MIAQAAVTSRAPSEAVAVAVRAAFATLPVEGVSDADAVCGVLPVVADGDAVPALRGVVLERDLGSRGFPCRLSGSAYESDRQ